MFCFQAPSSSSPSSRSDSCVETDEKKEFTSSAYSISSTTTFETEDCIEKTPRPINITPTLNTCPKSREALHKRARHHLRSLCRSKRSSKPTTSIPPLPQEKEEEEHELPFSFAILPPIALQIPPLHSLETNHQRAQDTALIITTTNITSSSRNASVQNTLESALQTFPAGNIFVVGTSSTSNSTSNSRHSSENKTRTLCSWFGVQYLAIPSRSHFAKQYVGVLVAGAFKYCLMIDEDVALPAEFPLYTDRIERKGLTIPSSWRRREDGDFAELKGVGYSLACDEDEDDWKDGEDEEGEEEQIEILEFTTGNLPESFFSSRTRGGGGGGGGEKRGGDSKVGCASFPQATISLWEREYLEEELFQRHPGYRNKNLQSRNWFLGFNLALVLSGDKNCW